MPVSVSRSAAFCQARAAGDGLGRVEHLLVPGRTAVLLGSSGAGKSTLLNRLTAGEVTPTRAVRSDGRGRHTAHRQLVRLPWGTLLIDTPGLRELQLWAGDESVDGLFATSTGWRPAAASRTAATPWSPAVPSARRWSGARCPRPGWRATASPPAKWPAPSGGPPSDAIAGRRSAGASGSRGCGTRTPGRDAHTAASATWAGRGPSISNLSTTTSVE
jgi:hypothetical protein